MRIRRKTLVSFSALFLVTSCAQSQKVATETPTNDTVISSTPPFQTREPERYRATRTITTVTTGGETTITKNFLARNGELRRDEVETGAQRVVYLTLPEGRFVVLPEEKLFADLTSTDQEAGNDEDSASSPDRLLHTDPVLTSYQRVGPETIGGRNAQKYRVVVNSSAQANVSLTETTIWIDEALHMPIKSETVSRDGTRITMELSDIALDVDGRIFQVPNGYGKIAFSELRTRLKNVGSKP